MKPLLQSIRLSNTMLTETNETEGMEVITSVETAPCDVCKNNPRVYKCPRCAAFSCSLECCRQHKIKMNCSGVRDRTEFVSSRNFKESDLKNDFHFLEDILQSKDRAKRTLNQNCGGEKKAPPPTKKKQNIAVADNEIPLILQDTYQRLESYPKSVRNLFQAAKERSIKLVLMPNQMTKRMLNKSMFNPKEGAIFWKVYVVFITSTEFKNEELFRVDLDSTKGAQKLSFAQEALIGVGLDGVNENKSLSEIFEKMVFSDNEVHRHALSSLRKNKANMRCLMHRIPSPSSNPVFIETAMDATLKECLAGQTIIEYPTLYFGSYAHTEHLNTLISEPTSSTSDATTAPTSKGIQVLPSVASHTSEGNNTTQGAKKNTFVSAHFDYDESDSGDEPVVEPMVQQPTERRVTFDTSKELLNLGMNNNTDESSNANNSILPNTRFNSANIADIVGSMKSFIDATLTEDKNTTNSTNPSITAKNTPLGESELNDCDDEDLDYDEDGENSEFLAQLKEYADMDVETLKAIIAAEEAAEAAAALESEGIDSTNNLGTSMGSNVRTEEPEEGEVVADESVEMSEA